MFPAAPRRIVASARRRSSAQLDLAELDSMGCDRYDSERAGERRRPCATPSVSVSSAVSDGREPRVGKPHSGRRDCPATVDGRVHDPAVRRGVLVALAKVLATAA